MCSSDLDTVRESEPRCWETIQDLGGCSVDIDCQCLWNSTSSNCGGDYGGSESYNCPPGVFECPPTGECATNQQGSDTCDDGFLTYSWTSIINWDLLNDLGTSNPNYPEDLRIINDSGTLRCDTLGLLNSCKDGSSTLTCPAQIELPFFDYNNFVITAVIIMLLYVVLKLTNKKSRKKRKH